MRPLSVAVAGLCLVLGAVGAAAASEVPRAVTLAGNEVSAPEDLGARSILVLSFRRAANAGAREWRGVLDGDPRTEGWSVYNVVVLEGAPEFVRRMVVRALRGDVPASRHDSFLVVEEGAQALAGARGLERRGRGPRRRGLRRAAGGRRGVRPLPRRRVAGCARRPARGLLLDKAPCLEEKRAPGHSARRPGRLAATKERVSATRHLGFRLDRRPKLGPPSLPGSVPEQGAGC